MASDNPLASIETYEVFVYSIQEQFLQVKISTLALKRSGKMFGELSGQLLFKNDIRLFVKERLDYKNKVIKGYGYEIWREKKKLYWYDSQPHPNDPSLASTHPHHKHIPPNIKHHRIPAPELSFSQPNLPFLIQEIVKQFLQDLENK